jgi:hypothetical protein
MTLKSGWRCAKVRTAWATLATILTAFFAAFSAAFYAMLFAAASTAKIAARFAARVAAPAACAVPLAAVLSLLLAAPALHAQGSRKDDIVFGPTGHPVSGATVRVCQPTATGTPCTPLATVYTDATLSVTSANPFQTDGIGNYHFYAPAGRYQIQISSPQITGTTTQNDVILPADLSSSGSGNNISAFGLTLGGNLSVAGNATISGTLTSSGFNPGTLTPTTLNVTGNSTVAGPRPYTDVTSPQFGAIADGGAEQATGSIAAGSNHLTISPGIGTWTAGMGLHVDGAGASGDVLLAHITSISGNVFTLDRNAGTTVSGASVEDDDTLAVQAALTSFCASPSNANGGSLYFPPGTYIISQNQSVNSGGIPFNISCPGVHLLGGNSGLHNGTPFVQPPTVSLLAHCGPSPNAQPMFATYYPNGNITFQNLVIDGCNQAVAVTSNVVRFWNTFLTAAGGGTNGSALYLQDTFWIYFDYGGLTTNSTSVPTLLMGGYSCSGCYAGVGNVYMSNSLLAGGPIAYVQQGNQNGQPSGHWVFRNITQESGNGDLIQITDPGGYTTGVMGPITLDDVQQADNSSPNAALINFNVPATSAGLSGVYINNSFSGAGAANAPAIKMIAGTLDHYFVTSCTSGCVSQVWNSSGNPVGSGMIESSGGLDFTDDVTNAGRLNTSPFSAENINGYGPAARFIQSGSAFASYGVDAANGWMFGSNAQAGWNAQISQSTPPNIDISFAANYPPTGVSGTVSNNGGAFSTGTYYVWVVSNTNSSCASSGGFSAPSNIYGPLTVGAGVSTAEFNLTWTAAPAGASAIQGYCVFVNNAKQYNFATQSTNLVSGATATGATVTTTAVAPGAFPITYQMVQEHHITPSGAIFNGNATPSSAAAPPYSPACLAATTCGAFLQLSPFAADSFARANSSSLGANWASNFSAAMVVSGNAAGAQNAQYGEQSWTGQTFNADQFSRATIASLDGNGVGVLVRLAGAGVDTGYLYFCSTASSSRVLQKRVAGASTTLATASGGSCAVNDVIELDVVGTSLIALHNGTVDLSVSDGSISSGAPGVAAYNTTTTSADTVKNWIGGSLAVGNATTSIFNQPNTWVQPQTFASPITSASLAVPNKTRACNIVRGDQSASALTTGNIQPQGSLCYIDAAATVAQVILMVDAGASTMELGYRHNGSTTAITPTLTPATVSGITDHVACANAGGTAITVEGNSVTCSSLTNSALAAGDFIETIGGAADGTTKRMSISMTFTPN